MSASVCPTVAAAPAPMCTKTVCACVCFMCLVNIYAPVNDEARKRQLLLPELPSCQLPRGCLKVAVEASDANCSLLSGRRLCACVGVCLRSGVVN